MAARADVLGAAADRPGQKAPPAARLVRFNARTLAAGFRYPQAGLKNAATVQVHPTGLVLSSFGAGQACELTRLGRRGLKDRSVVVEIPAPVLTRGGAWMPGNANVVGATTVGGRPVVVVDLVPKKRGEDVRIVVVKRDFLGISDDGTGGPPVRAILTQSPSGRLLGGTIFVGKGQTFDRAQAAIQGVTFPG
jgi:hypothetical protein